MKRRLFIIILVMGAFTEARPANDGGTESPFSFGAGARELSMGGSDLSTCSFETAPFWNPSRLANAQQFQFSGFHSQLFDSDVAYQYVGLIAPTLDFGTFGIGVFRLGIKGIEVRDVNNLLLDETSDNRLGVYFGYGRKFSNFDLGAAITLEHHSLSSYSATTTPGINLSIGKTILIKSEFFNRLHISLNAANVIKPSIELDNERVSYPFAGVLSTTLGISPLKNDDHALSLAVSLKKTEQASPIPRIGLEYAFNEMLFLRGGMNDSKIAAGIGLKYSVVSFDYALVDRDLDFVHTFTLTTSFGKNVKERLEDRIAKRESEFNQLMGERLSEKNRSIVSSLELEGRKHLENGRLVDAVSVLERTLFMAKANGFDTSKVSEIFNDANQRLNEALKIKQYREYIESAADAFAKNDFISARYFATLAIQIQSNSADAKKLIEQANKAISSTTAREDLVMERLAKSDSLLNYGKTTEAIDLLTGLSQLYSADRRITQMLNKAHFERLKEKAAYAHSQQKDIEALLLIDSASTIFPNHEWLLALRSAIKAEQARNAAQEVRAAVSSKPKLSGQLLKDAEDEYALARTMFTKGDLTGAIEHWENVERFAPDYQSVRDYLVKAYKFLGVDFYGKGDLRKAINVWQKASLLVPTNEEIKKYIQRTETELRKLKQLSYETE